MEGLAKSGAFISQGVLSGGLECTFVSGDIVVHSMNASRDTAPMIAFCTDPKNTDSFQNSKAVDTAEKVERLVRAVSNKFCIESSPFSSYAIYTCDKVSRFVGYINFFTTPLVGWIRLAVILTKEFKNDEMRDNIAKLLHERLIPFISAYQDRGTDLKCLITTAKEDNEGAANSLYSLGFRPVLETPRGSSITKTYKYTFGEQGSDY